MALLWPKHGLHLVLQIGSSWIIINVPRNVPNQISTCWVYPVAHTPKNCKTMAFLWPKHGPHLVLQIGPSWIKINIPSDDPCQISQFWVYTIVPFFIEMSKNGPYGQNTVLTWSFKIFFLNHNQCVQGCSMPNLTILVYPIIPFS